MSVAVEIHSGTLCLNEVNCELHDKTQIRCRSIPDPPGEFRRGVEPDASHGASRPANFGELRRGSVPCVEAAD